MSQKCLKRLQQELKEMRSSNVTNIEASPDEQDMTIFYYVLEGPPATPYEDGLYMGVIHFSHNYPFSPPTIRMITPNGRFQTETNICLSTSSYHPEQWSPVNNTSTILQGLLSFMVENTATAGSITTDDAVKRTLAQQSHTFNIQHPKFQALFPKRFETAKAKVELAKAKRAKATSTNSSPSSPVAPPSTDNDKKADAATENNNAPAAATTNNNNHNNNTPAVVANDGFGKGIAVALCAMAIAAAVVLKAL